MKPGVAEWPRPCPLVRVSEEHNPQRCDPLQQPHSCLQPPSSAAPSPDWSNSHASGAKGAYLLYKMPSNMGDIEKHFLLCNLLHTVKRVYILPIHHWARSIIDLRQFATPQHLWVQPFLVACLELLRMVGRKLSASLRPGRLRWGSHCISFERMIWKLAGNPIVHFKNFHLMNYYTRW